MDPKPEEIVSSLVIGPHCGAFGSLRNPDLWLRYYVAYRKARASGIQCYALALLVEG